MATAMYDEALLKKLQNWTHDIKMNIYGPDDVRHVFEVVSDQQNDEPLQLPILTLSRPGGYQIINSNKRTQTYDGLMLNSEEGLSVTLNGIPISIPYQIDVYTRYYKQADAFIRDLVFNIINHPTFEVVVPYNGVNYVHMANMFLSDDVQDNSSIPERLIVGQFTRLSLKVVVDDAYLFDARVRKNVQIEADGLIIRKDEDDKTDDIIEKLI